MSKSSPKLQFELDVSNRFRFAAVLDNQEGNQYLVIYLKGSDVNYVKVHMTEEQIKHIHKAIGLQLRSLEREREKEEELV